MPNNLAVGYDGSGGFGGAFYAAFKQIYGPKRVEPIVYRNAPFFKGARKVDDFEGSNYAHSILYEDPDSGSTSFTQALAQANTSSQSARFTIWRGREYQAINILAEEVAASRSDYGSLLRKKDYETRRVLARMGYRMDIALHGNASGSLVTFTTGAALTGTSTTIDVNSFCTRLAVGLPVQAALTSGVANDGTPPTLLNAGSVMYITGISRNASGGVTTLTLSATVGGAAAAQNAYFGGTLATTTQYTLIRAGDGVGFGQNVLNGGICGLKAWLPPPAPVGQTLVPRIATNDAFWGFNRNVDIQRLAGCYYQAQPGEKYQVTFQNAGMELFVNGGGNEDSKMTLLVAPFDYTGYALELGPQVRYADTENAGSGFKDLKVRTQCGDLTLKADPQIEPGLFYILDSDTYYIKTLNALPHLDQQDGLQGIRLNTADAQQMRWRGWYQLIFDEPGRNLVGRCI